MELGLAALTKKQKKAEWYLARKNRVSTPLNSSLPSSSPEPTSPSSLSIPQTPASRSSISSSPSPNPSQCHVHVARYPNPFSPQSDGFISDSGDTVQLWSNESSPLQVHPLRRQDGFYGDPPQSLQPNNTSFPPSPDNTSGYHPPQSDNESHLDNTSPDNTSHPDNTLPDDTTPSESRLPQRDNTFSGIATSHPSFPESMSACTATYQQQLSPCSSTSRPHPSKVPSMDQHFQ